MGYLGGLVDFKVSGAQAGALTMSYTIEWNCSAGGIGFMGDNIGWQDFVENATMRSSAMATSGTCPEPEVRLRQVYQLQSNGA